MTIVKEKVLEKKTNLEAVATPLEDGKFQIDFEDGQSRVLAESTFRRHFNTIEKLEESTEVEEPTIVQDEVVELVEETSTEEKPEVDAELLALMEDGEEIKGPEAETTVEEKPANKALEDLNLNIRLQDWFMEGTKGGKTDKVKSMIEIRDMVMEITEYSGYITDVKLFEVNPNPPENDPDANLNLVYRSVKMSLKDTLEWMGLNEDDMKIARKEITAIRKAVKAQHIEAQKEQELIDEQDELETKEA